MSGRAFQNYVAWRNRHKEELPRRIWADFFIGAHASVHSYRLITLDQRLCRAAFPKLEIVTFYLKLISQLPNVAGRLRRPSWVLLLH